MSSPIVTRAEWNARPPKTRSRNIRPAHITAHYGGPSPWANGAENADHNRCPTIVRAWQAFHMGKGWSDIAYTSIICPHGFRYIGRDVGWRTAANGTNAGNETSYAVCYLAGGDDVLTDAAKAAYLDEVARIGQPLDRVHSDWKPTACPGVALADWVRAGTPAPGPTAPPLPAPAPEPAPDAGNALAAVAECMKGTHGPGATGPCVNVVQAVVNAKLGSRLAVDGQYGKKTAAAVKRFQKAAGISADGIVGPQTWAALNRTPDK